jgi:error-prone DNA polymerase
MDGEFHTEKREHCELPDFTASPLQPMTSEEKLIADYNGTGMTVGPHPLSHHRKKLKRQGVRCANELSSLPNGMRVRIAGAVIARQRPGTAKGFVFLSMEDETGIANAIITPQTYDKYHLIIVHQQFLLVEGHLQNQENVISVKAEVVRPLPFARIEASSHDFH